MELVSRGVVEVLTQEELETLLKEKSPVVYHGYEPSGTGIHVGYLIAVNKLIDFQKAGLKVVTLFADLHAWLNEKGSLERAARVAELYNASFEALGLDTRKSKYVLGSTFQLEEGYTKDLLKLSLKVRLKRARRAMDVIGRDEENPHVAQTLYPLMQALDMKALKVDIAFGDMAQRKIHVLAREELPALGYKSPVCIHHAVVSGLTGGKMSSSIPESSIMVDESPASIKRKVVAAFCPAKKVDKNPVLELCEHAVLPRVGKLKVERPAKYGGDVEFTSYPELSKAFASGKLHPQDLKAAVSAALIDILEPARKHLSKPKFKKIRDGL